MHYPALIIVLLCLALVGCAAIDEAVENSLCERSRAANRIASAAHEADRLARAALLSTDTENAEEVAAASLAVSKATSRALQMVSHASDDLGVYYDATATHLLESVTAANAAALDASEAMIEALSDDRDAILVERAVAAERATVNATGTALKAARRAVTLFRRPGCS